MKELNYDIRVFDDPNELRDTLRKINKINNKASKNMVVTDAKQISKDDKSSGIRTTNNDVAENGRLYKSIK